MVNHTLEKHWDIVKQKGPVNIITSQQAFENSWVKVLPFISESDRNELMIARSHSALGEGRGEWDSVAKRIEKELLKKIRRSKL